MIKYFYNKKLIIALIDKVNNKSFLDHLEAGPAVVGDNLTGGIINDLDGGALFQPENYFRENNREYLVGLLEPYKIKARVASNEFKNATPKYPEKKKELEKLANSLKETDNPVLMIVKLKK